ncbi:hypothetical protein [Flavobacterium sp. SM2513]|uniref:hypothetical protein n=1 Tax=Flavobacterium sp. SM2513 TaxID=3424766 RepID=UPI003D7FBCC7
MKNLIQKQRRFSVENKNNYKAKCLKTADKLYNSTWGIGALLAAISAWTAGILYV